MAHTNLDALMGEFSVEMAKTLQARLFNEMDDRLFFASPPSTCNADPEADNLTCKKLTEDMCRALDEMDKASRIPDATINWTKFNTGFLGGIRIVETTSAVVADGYNFPPSKNRSARIHKKLIKRFGTMVRYVPTSYKMGDVLYVHPAMMRELKHHT